MDINDYSTRLSQARSNFRDAADELKDHYNSEVDELSKNHENVQAKQRNNYEKSKSEIEQNVASTIDQKNKEVKESMLQRTEQFRNEIASQQEEFENNRQDIKRNFDDRLNYLRDSYNKDVSSREQNYNDKTAQSELRYSERMDHATKDFQDKISEFDKTSKDAVREQKVALDIEKKGQELRHKNELADFVESGNSSRAKMVEKQQRDLQNLRNTQSDELRNRNDHHAKTVDSIYAQKSKEAENMSANFKKLTNDINDRNNRNNDQMAKLNRERITELERQYAQTSYQNKREMQEKLKGGSQADRDELKSAELTRKFDTKIKNINESIDNMRYKDQLDKERMSTQFQNSAKERNLAHAKQIDTLEKETRDFKNKTLKENQERTDNVIGDYKSKLVKAQLDNEQQSIKDRQSANNRLQNQRQEFGRVVNQMSTMNQEAISELQNEHAKEKSKFINDTRMAHHNNVEQLKDDFNSRMSKKEGSLNQRLESKEKELNQTVNRYEEKLAKLETESQAEISKIKTFEEERRVEDFREFKRQMRKMTDTHTKEKIALKDELDRKFLDEKHKNDVKVNEIVQKYESQLDLERNETRRNFKTKIKELESNYQRLADQSELEKDLIRNQFERRIEEMQKINQMQLDEMSREKNSLA
ncbi:hypothetical protein BIY24_11760 [Halobacteriovorax marinus]|uniref:hypothetical protein n=1 Tax=Halobacteriovorax marinus TaxID=97084 RepID=UPI000BC2C906|nr:hypothetical protein [Halobacteriovorax marinus]ATH08596.1 hypothetical protein BIY24_11760 [Halobacteriovorax marinus]